jgi:hypothetical protein
MAAGVTEKLWEVSDTVEMLEQWELPNFALQWIKEKSQGWLAAHPKS